MPQFDVHVSPGRNRQTVRYVVNVQSQRYDRLATRVVIPLMVANGVPAGIEIGMMPGFEVGGTRVYLNPLEMQTVPRSVPRSGVASLADDTASARVIAAIDLMITRAYG
jgi:toxin CcdB